MQKESKANVTKTLQGKVLKASMDKTVVIAIVRKEKHKLYKKYVQRVTKLYVHDEQNECKVGDTIKVAFSRPLSKLKRWVFVEKVAV